MLKRSYVIYEKASPHLKLHAILMMALNGGELSRFKIQMLSCYLLDRNVGGPQNRWSTALLTELHPFFMCSCRKQVT